ncbi:MAG: hypothetical protein JSV82_06450 [Planctomycetota bacterium]|nr:MAG: hypothetical protein JSV82_06450 [Planctomycetota bacterium]
MIFLAVGTQFPFDRLVKSVDIALGYDGSEKVVAQIGNSLYQPRSFKAVPFLEKHLFDKCVHEASCIISHAGMGIITMALDNNKPLLVMPRLKRYGEVVNDHQIAIARKFEGLGHILVAYSVENLPEKLRQLKTFVPKPRQSQAKAVAERIGQFLSQIGAEK